IKKAPTHGQIPRRAGVPRVGLSLLVATLTVAPAGSARAQTIRVVDVDGHASASSCSDAATAFTTITAAIAAASNGDTVQVCPGTYVEKIDFGGKAIPVHSPAGAAATTVDAAAAGSVVTFASAETAASVLDGFTIRNGLAAANASGLTDGSGIRI